MATLLRRVADFFRETFLQTRPSDTADQEVHIKRIVPLAVRQRLRHHTVSPAVRRSTVHWAHYLWCTRSTAPRQIRALPTEVCERIIDFVAEESPYYDLFDLWNVDVYETLLACALVCRAWTPRSRFHLFRFLGASCSPHSPRDVEGLYSMLKRQRYLQQYVEALLVKGDDQEIPTMHTLPLKAPQLLTYLEYLRLADGILYLPPASIVAMRQFTIVTQLSLERITFWSAHDLRRVICTMLGLQALEISWPTWKTPHDLKTDENTRYPPSPIRLTDIYIFAEVDTMQNGHLAFFIEWLARSGVATSLNRIGLWQLMIPDSRLLTAVQSVIEASKDSLSDLYLSWCPDVDPLPLCASLSSFDRLRYLGFNLPYHTETVSALASIFDKMTVQCNQLLLNFDQCPSACSTPKGRDWEALDRALQRPTWKSLKDVQLRRLTVVPSGESEFVWGNVLRYDYAPYGSLEAKLWCEELKEYLPLTCKRGILEYFRGSDWSPDVVPVS